MKESEPIQVRQFYVSFLREGFHNLSFELREESILPGGGWHCREDGVEVFDRISTIVHVKVSLSSVHHF